METKENFLLLLKDKRDSVTVNGQHSNLTFNKNHQISSDALSGSPKSVVTERKKIFDYDSANDSQTIKESFYLWNKSTKNLSSKFVNNDSGKEDRLKKAKVLNASTLSLHIEVYENSNESNLFDVGTKEGLKKNGLIKNGLTAKQMNFESTTIIRNPFEFPRQQESGEAIPPEIAQYRASQQLFNSNLQTPDTNYLQLLPQHSGGSSPFLSKSVSNFKQMLPKASSTPAVLPDRYYSSFKANPTAFCYFETAIQDIVKHILIVGTVNGTIEIVALEKGAIPEVKFEHKSESQINAIILITKEPKICFVAQFRGMELLWFNIEFENGMINLVKIKSFLLSHFGFCQSIWDNNEKRMLIPGKDDDNELLSILYENSGEKTISFGADFLFSSFKKRHPETDLTVEDCFKGTISSIQQIHETTSNGQDERDRILIGFEDATFIIYDIRTKEVINLFKAPSKYSQLIAFAVSKDSEKQHWRIVVTVCSRIFEVIYENEKFELTKLIKKTGFAGVNCSHVCFNNSGDILICGFSSGRIEFYNVPKYSIFKVMNFHESTILSMNVLSSEENDEVLFIGDEEGRLSQMNMKKMKL